MKHTSFRPMLSGKCDDLAKVTLPVFASPKLDGIRCVIRNGKALSRNLKPIPNHFVQEALRGLSELDGELIVGDPTKPDTWNATQSGIMSEEDAPDFVFHVFDHIPTYAAQSYFDRLEKARTAVANLDMAHVQMVDHILFTEAEPLACYEALCVQHGYEGIMLRSLGGAYKFGRSTVREGGLLKVKRFQDAEAVVVDMVERYHNANEATVDALGLTKRSTHKANKVAMGTLGALVCEGVFGGGPVRFEIGTGFTDAQREEIWATSDYYVGLKAKLKYQALTPDGVPRFPVFLGFRDERDM